MIAFASKRSPSFGGCGRFASLFLGGMSTACLSESAPQERLGEAQSALTDGIADNGARPALVRISGCGGVLIASNVILTAAHCIDDYTEDDIPSDPVGPFQGTIGFTVQGLPDQDFQVDNTSPTGGIAALHLHPDWPSEGTAGDVGVIVLQEPISRRDVVPARVAGSFVGELALSWPNPPGSHKVGAHLYGRRDCENAAAYAPGHLRYIQTEAILFGSDVWARGEADRICAGDSGSPWFTSHWPGYTGGVPEGHIFSVTSATTGSRVEGARIVDDFGSWVRVLGTDRDNDGVVAAVDNCDMVSNPAQTDTDGDGIGNACDVCPLHFEEWRHDDDGDGLLNCLDTCPDDPSGPFGGYGDHDGDGVCDPKDNCRFYFNPNQRNANHHSEGRWSAVSLGDVCEPVPVPDAEADPSETLGSWGVNHPWHRNQWLQTRNHSITAFPQRSRGRIDGSPIYVELVPPSPITSHLRFCQHPDPTNSNAIKCLDQDGIDDRHLELLLSGPEAEDRFMPYHRITMSFAPGQRGATTALSYDDAPRQWTWSYTSDALFWIANDIVDVPPPEGEPFLPGGAGSGLDGVMWLHAATSIGHPTTVPLYTGTHEGLTEQASAALQDTQQLANRYLALDPERVTQAQWTRPFQNALPLFLWRVLPDPPRRWRVGADPTSMRGAAELIVPFEGEYGLDFGLLSLDGQVQHLGDRLGKSLLDSLRNTSHQWLSAAEPHRAFVAEGAPLVVGLEAHGRGVVDTVVDDEDAGLLLGEQDRGLPTRDLPGRAPWREGHRAVYSAQLGRLFVLGGRDARGVARGDIGSYELATDTWSALPVTTPLGGTLLAATYSFTDRSLYVLDRPQDKLRILRISTLNGVVEHLVSLDASSAEHSLATDLDGSLLLLVSGPIKHLLFRLWRKESGWVYEELLRESTPAVHPVLVDEHGYVVYQRGAEWHGTRYPQLVAENHPIAGLPERL